MKNLMLLAAMLLSSCLTMAQEYYLHCGQILDVTSGKYLKEHTIVISGNSITAVNRGFSEPNDPRLDNK